MPGECGLDFNRNFSPQDVQREWFERQVLLAAELGKPLFMHCRDAGDAFADVLRSAGVKAAAAGLGGGSSSNGDSGSSSSSSNNNIVGLPVPGVLHCFTGTESELNACLALGLHIGVTGWVCDDRPERGGAELASLLPSIPTERLMIETDAPYLVPRTIKPSKARPHRNEPALLPHVLQTVAAARGEGEAEVARATTGVAAAFFRLPGSILNNGNGA
jgi:TatD DNase family protein